MAKTDSLRLVWILWVDTMSCAGWQSREDSKLGAQKVDLRCESVGWIIYDGKDRITIVQTITEGSVNERLTIPRVAVLEIVDILG